MAYVVWRLVKDRPPQLVVAGVARDSDVAHAPAALGGLRGLARRCRAASSP